MTRLINLIQSLYLQFKIKIIIYLDNALSYNANICHIFIRFYITHTLLNYNRQLLNYLFIFANIAHPGKCWDGVTKKAYKPGNKINVQNECIQIVCTKDLRFAGSG